MRIERPKGTVIVPVRGTRYVYKVAEKRYLKDKQYNVNKRVCVGKMEDEIHMIPNARFYQVFPELAEQNEAPYCSDIHVFYDDVKGAEQRKSIMRRFALYDKELEKLVEKKLTRKFNVTMFEKYYRLKFYDDYLISFRRKEKEIEKELDHCGYFVIVTSEKMTAEEALTKYRNRDTTEKQFLIEKSFLGGDTWRVHSDESIESKQLISFVALIIRNELFKALEKLRKKEKKRFTIPAALRELDRIIITRDVNGTFSMRYALTASQKDILKCVGVSEEDARGKASEITKKYSESQI